MPPSPLDIKIALITKTLRMPLAPGRREEGICQPRGVRRVSFFFWGGGSSPEHFQNLTTSNFFLIEFRPLFGEISKIYAFFDGKSSNNFLFWPLRGARARKLLFLRVGGRARAQEPPPYVRYCASPPPSPQHPGLCERKKIYETKTSVFLSKLGKKCDKMQYKLEKLIFYCRCNPPENFLAPNPSRKILTTSMLSLAKSHTKKV